MVKMRFDWQEKITPIVIGLIAFFIFVGPEILNPQFISWIAEGDPSQQYLGWEFFRRSPWVFPIGANPTFGMDIGGSIVYSDSIPLLAIVFKLLLRDTTTPFQYFGWWTLLSFVMQAWFAWLLAQIITRNSVLKILITITVTIAPPFLWRLAFQNYMLGQFFILAALYLNFRSSQKDSNRWPWVFILSLSIAVNFYLFFMCGCLWIADRVDRLRLRQVAPLSLLKETLLLVVMLTLIAWQLGYFTIGSSSSFSTNMYGGSRLNLLTLIDANGWSSISKYFQVLQSNYASMNYESFHYLGLGLLLLIPFALIGLIKTKKLNFYNIKSHFSLVLILFALAIYAITNQISIGSYEYIIPIPDAIYAIATILRSSGRLFLPLFYCVVLAILFLIVNSYPKKVAVLLLSICTFLQIFDTSAGWLTKKNYLLTQSKASISNELKTPLKNSFWESAAKKYQSVLTVFSNPVKGLIPENWSPFAAYAIKNALKTNSNYLARYNEDKLTLLRQAIELEIQSEAYSQGSFYIIGEEMVIPVLMHLNPDKDLFAKIDGFNVLAPGWVNCEACPKVDPAHLIQKTIPKMYVNVPIQFSKDSIGPNFLIGVDAAKNVGYGWAYPEAWGVWSEGRKAKMVIPLPDGQAPKQLVLTVTAFTSDQFPVQPVDIWINGSLQQKAILNKAVSKEIIIPLSQDKVKNYLVIELVTPNAVSPKEIKLGDDNRKLAIGLIAAEFTN